MEHVIQDGGGPSRVKIIESHSKFHTILSTSPDFGLYSGFNMGLKLASGNYIGFLNSDDMYEKFFLEKSITHLNASGCDWVFGNIIIKQNKANYYIPGKVDYFMKPWMNFSRFHHNTVLARREIFEKIGHFPETLMGRKLKYCADYWWFIRAQQSGFIGVYCPDLIGFMQDGGASSGSKKEIYQEAAFVAQTLYPSKTLQIRIIWLLRFIDNEYLSRFNMGLVRKFRSIGRKIYGLIAGYAFNFRVEAGTKR